MNKLKSIRERRNLTQSELAETSGLSLRTIQRIESGTTPKGHTLKVLIDTLDIEPAELQNIESTFAEENDDLKKLKLLNTSILSFLIIPFGNVIFPLIIYIINKKENFRKTATKIISFQILWSLITSLLLILSPFIHKKFQLENPLILWVLLLCFLINLSIILINSYSLTKRNNIKISSPLLFF